MTDGSLGSAARVPSDNRRARETRPAERHERPGGPDDRRAPKLKGSVGEGPNQTNYSDRSSVRILGIERKPRKTTSSK